MTDFDGITYVPELDCARLSGQLECVRSLMSDGQARFVSEIMEHCGGDAASITARLRDLRKPKFGGYIIVSERLGKGLWCYTMVGRKAAE